MANDKKNKDVLNETVLRAHLKRSMQAYTVSDSLKNQTLDLCRAALSDISDDEISVTRTEYQNAFILAKAKRQMKNGKISSMLSYIVSNRNTLIRVVGSVAACIIVIAMFADVLPGNMGTGFDTSAESLSDSALAPLASQEENFAKIESAGAEASIAASESMEAAPAPELARAIDSAGTAAAPPVAVGEGAVPSEAKEEIAPIAMMQLGNIWSSWSNNDISSALFPQPSDESVSNAVQEFLALNQNYTFDVTRVIPVFHLSSNLDANTLAEAASLKNLVRRSEIAPARDTMTQEEGILPAEGVGAWMALIESGSELSILPLTVVEPVVQASSEVRTLTPAELLVPPSPIVDLGVLFNEEALSKVLSEAGGSPVTEWYIVDVEGGTGFWVAWKIAELEHIMPFMSNPSALGLENGRAYTWDMLRATVIPNL